MDRAPDPRRGDRPADLEARALAALSRAHGHFAVLVDGDLAILWASGTVEAMLGHRDVIGRNVLDLVHPDDVALAGNGLLHHVENGTRMPDTATSGDPSPC